MKLKNQNLTASNYFTAIDPGSRKSGGGTGIAYFDRHKIMPIKTMIVTCNWHDYYRRCITIADKVVNEIESLKGPIFIEEPKYFDSHTGQTAARSSSLFKLICFYGILYATIHGKINGCNRTIVPLKINEWKGQLSKKQVSTRVEKICGEKFKGDICDAVGIGLYLLGKL